MDDTLSHHWRRLEEALARSSALVRDAHTLLANATALRTRATALHAEIASKADE